MVFRTLVSLLGQFKKVIEFRFFRKIKLDHGRIRAQGSRFVCLRCLKRSTLWKECNENLVIKDLNLVTPEDEKGKVIAVVKKPIHH